MQYLLLIYQREADVDAFSDEDKAALWQSRDAPIAATAASNAWRGSGPI